MASRFIAISIPARPRLNADRIILAVAVAFAVFSVLVTWQTFAPAPSGSAVGRLEAARPVAGAPDLSAR